MRFRHTALALGVGIIVAPVWAQPSAQDPALVAPPAWAFNDIACAPALAPVAKAAVTPPAFRVIGSQDTVIRDILGPGDTLIVSGGSTAGLETGQRYFVRRLLKTRAGGKDAPATVHTAGWIQILGVDTAVATATVVYACDGILLDDYLEPFTPPMIAARMSGGNTPHYENMGHIMTGADGANTAGKGQVMTIDLGSDAGVVVGQRFMVFRARGDQRFAVAGPSKTFLKTEGQLPLVEIGQVLVVGVRADNASVQVLASTDAVTTGDLVAPIQ